MLDKSRDVIWITGIANIMIKMDDDTLCNNCLYVLPLAL